MSCPTCDHTMHLVGEVLARGTTSIASVASVYWCPRCGTVKSDVWHEPVERPKFVDHMRAWVKATTGPDRIARSRAVYEGLGLAGE